jgi:hypothetical protein
LPVIQDDAHKVYEGIAQVVDGIPFVQTTQAAVAKAAGITTAPGLAMIKNSGQCFCSVPDDKSSSIAHSS